VVSATLKINLRRKLQQYQQYHLDRDIGRTLTEIDLSEHFDIGSREPGIKIALETKCGNCVRRE
jgi:hypothetical protein